MKPISYCYFLIGVFFSPITWALDPIEKEIVKVIDNNLPQAVSQLEQVVNINSGTLNLAGVEKVGREFQSYFDELDFDTQWVDGSGFDRAGHLVASYGDKGPKVLLIGHLDTVFAKDDAFQKYTVLDERYVAGPGITDMKGGNMIIVAALRSLKSLKLLQNLQIRVILTGDEEHSGHPLSLSKQALIEAGKWADIALGFEDGDSNIKTAVIARRGAVSWKLSVKGTPAHSSQIFSQSVGDGAIFEMARILNALRESLSDYGNLTFNPALVLGGTSIDMHEKGDSGNAFGKTNVVSQIVEVKGDLRALSVDELAHAKSVMNTVVAQSLPHTSASLIFDEGYPPMAPTEANYTLLKQYSEVSEALGYGVVEAVNPRNAGAADISFVANHVDMAMDGMGLMGSGGHTKDEKADMQSFAKNMHKAAILLYRLSKE